MKSKGPNIPNLENRHISHRITVLHALERCAGKRGNEAEFCIQELRHLYANCFGGEPEDWFINGTECPPSEEENMFAIQH